jgi:hypothetical protein
VERRIWRKPPDPSGRSAALTPKNRRGEDEDFQAGTSFGGEEGIK